MTYFTNPNCNQEFTEEKVSTMKQLFFVTSVKTFNDVNKIDSNNYFLFISLQSNYSILYYTFDFERIFLCFVLQIQWEGFSQMPVQAKTKKL